MGVQEVRREGEGYQAADNYTFFYGKENVMRFVAFPATEYDVLLGYQPGQMVER
jgi:hypothetical protein